MSDALPVYNPNEPAHPQENDWDCMQESVEWALYAWGRTPSDDWLEDSMIAAGVLDPSVGCTDASGAATARWINTEYGEFGYVAQNVVSVDFDDVAAEASERVHPLTMNGAGWYHWTGVRGYDAVSDLLLLANPAQGWKGVGQTMDRDQFRSLGPFNMVRVTHPAAEGMVPIDPDVPDVPIDYSPWTEDGDVGSGLIEMMQADATWPAQSRSTWLPLGSYPADIEECYGVNGVRYAWLLGVSAGYRYRPS